MVGYNIGVVEEDEKEMGVLGQPKGCPIHQPSNQLWNRNLESRFEQVDGWCGSGTGYKFTLQDLFPTCVLPNCANSGVVHQHILPHQQEILDCRSKYLYCQGGVGSAKSLAFAVKCVWLCMTIPNNVGIVSRRDYKLLYKSSWLEVKRCIRRLVDLQVIDYTYWAKKMYTHKTQGDYSVITFPNGSVLYAIQGKNFTEALGPSYGFFWVDDAQESLEEFFIGDNTSGGLLSRLREPHVHYNTHTYHDTNRPHGSLHGMVSSNPPPYGHWLHKLFGSKPGTHTIGNDSVTWLMVSTKDNPFVGEDYADGLMSVQTRMGHSTNVARRLIFGESVKAYKGVPVFPQFDRKVHVAPVKFRDDLPLIRSWDFGHDHPAVVFSNVYRCKFNENHYFTLSEIAHAYNVTVYRLYDEYVLPHTRALYANAKLIKDCGDRAGFRTSSSNKDARSDMKILIAEYHLPFRYRYTNLVPSLQYMRSLLQPKTPCKCGLPYVLVSNKCPALIDALDGGYHFSRNRNGQIGDKPIEDKQFADVACAWRYGAENYVKWGMAFEDQVQLKQENTTSSFNIQRSQQAIENNNLSWLEQADRVLMEKIAAGRA